MRTALIGHTGFVGGNLKFQHRFDEHYNSKNIEAIAGQSFDLMICAGASAEKWRVNQDPEADMTSLGKLTRALETVTASKMVLISTIDVYPHPVGVDEETAIDTDTGSTYGRHRFALERFVRNHFDALIVRLPGLFGEGLKKNVVYDFLHGNQVDRVDARSVYQFYNVGHLWSDIEKALRNLLPLVNFATEPVSVAEVVKSGFGFDFADQSTGSLPAMYDFRSRYADLFGGANGYLYKKKQVLSELQEFVSYERLRL